MFQFLAFSTLMMDSSVTAFRTLILYKGATNLIQEIFTGSVPDLMLDAIDNLRLVCTLADTLSAFLRVRVLYQLLMEKCVSTKIKVYLLN